MPEPKVSKQGVDGLTGVNVDNTPVLESRAEQVLRMQEEYYAGRISRPDYIKFLRRVKAEAERGE